MTKEAALCCACIVAILSTSGCASPPSEIIFLRGSISTVSCMRHPRSAPTLCVFGEGMMPGCTETCRYAFVPGFDNLVLGFEMTVSGILVDVNTEKPIEGMQVHLFLPTHMRYTTLSRFDGTFTVFVGTDSPSDSDRVEQADYNLGLMRTLDEGQEVHLVNDFTPQFREAHPDLIFRTKETSNFAGKTISLGTH